MTKVTIRHAKETDDYLKIASCIYQTDPFIYPAAFGADARQAIFAISKLMEIDNGLFHPNNLVIACCEDEIMGVLVYNKNGAVWDLKECMDAVKGIVPDMSDFVHVSDVYFSIEAELPAAGHIEIVACCVMPEYRNAGVGRKLLNWFIREFPLYTFTLDVLANNPAAINLYKKCGFEIIGERKGFSLEDESRPDCYQMVRCRRI